MGKKVHPFACTLGPGPYRWIGTFDLGAVLSALSAGNINGYNAGLQAMPKLEDGGGTCAHCGQAITLIQIVETGEGKRFGVGSDCVLKCSAEGDLTDLSLMERKLRQIKREKGQEQRERRRQKLAAEVFKLMDAHAGVLRMLPHPSKFHPTKTMLDYCEFCYRKGHLSLGAAKELKYQIDRAVGGSHEKV